LALSLNFLVLELLTEFENSEKFQTLYGKIRSTLNRAGLEGESRDEIWTESVMNVTFSSNIISTKLILKCPFELLYGERPMLHNNLKMFGEVGDVITKEKYRPS
jgi:hypothetical protein